METAIERHGLGCVEGGDLQRQREEKRVRVLGQRAPDGRKRFFVGQTCHMRFNKNIRGHKKLNMNDLCPLELLHLLHCGEIVDSSILDDRQEDKQEACPQVDVYGFDVRHLWHRG